MNLTTRKTVRTDSELYSRHQLCGREEYHLRVQDDPGPRNRMMRAVPEKERTGFIEKYKEAYRGCYGADEENLHIDKTLADVYTNIDRKGIGANRYTQAAAQMLRGAETTKTAAQPTGPPAEKNDAYSIEEISGKNANYGNGVLLDTDIFKGISPRRWGNVLENFVYEHLADTNITMFDEDGNEETVHIARENDRVRKDGSANSRKVLDELARYKGDNAKALATVYLSEILATSRQEEINDEHTHQWLDENGWRKRKAYAEDRNGKIYEMTLHIADGKRGLMMYKISNVHQIDKAIEGSPAAQLPSSANGSGRSTSQNPSTFNSVNQSEENSKGMPENLSEEQEKALGSATSAAEISAADNHPRASSENSKKNAPKLVNQKYSPEKGSTDQFSEESETPGRETLTTKAREYLGRAERVMAGETGEALEVPTLARRDGLGPIVWELSGEFLTTGDVSPDTAGAAAQPECPFLKQLRWFQTLSRVPVPSKRKLRLRFEKEEPWSGQSKNQSEDWFLLRERNALASSSPQNANGVRVLKRRSHGADKAKTSPKTGFYCGSGMRSGPRPLKTRTVFAF